MGEREAWLDLLFVCGRESEGHRSDLFLVYVGGRESWLDLLLVCGKESEGHRSDLSLVYGRERVLVGPVACVGGIVRGIGQTFPLCMGEGERPGWTCCLCVRGRVRGIGQTFSSCMGEGERPGCTCCLCVGGRVRGIGQTFSLCMVGIEAILRPFPCVWGRERGLVVPVACVWEGE